jgi:hypothetical protein
VGGIGPALRAEWTLAIVTGRMRLGVIGKSHLTTHASTVFPLDVPSSRAADSPAAIRVGELGL